MTTIEERLKALDPIPLLHGAHDKQFCALDAAAWIAGEEHSDRPKCVSPVIGAFVRPTLDDEARQALRSYAPRMIGTAGDGYDKERAWIAIDWLARVCTPAWLELAGLKDSAKALRSLSPITAATVGKAQSTVEAVQKKADAAWDATKTTVWPGAGVAAWPAATVAVWAAVAWDIDWEAAWAAAGDAAWDATWDATWDTAWAAAAVAAWETVGDVALDAAAEAKEQGGNYSVQYDAAYEAARTKLGSEPLRKRFEPVKAELHRSVHELLDRMIDGPFGEHA